jgi:hypothetical protein
MHEVEYCGCALKTVYANFSADDLIHHCTYCTRSMSAQSNSSHADESPPIIVFQSRALRIPSVGDNEFGSLKDLQFSTPRKRSLETDSARSPTHISKRSRLCAGGSSAPHPKFELRVQPVNMSFVLSGKDCWLVPMRCVCNPSVPYLQLPIILKTLLLVSWLPCNVHGC